MKRHAPLLLGLCLFSSLTAQSALQSRSTRHAVVPSRAGTRFSRPMLASRGFLQGGQRADLGAAIAQATGPTQPDALAGPRAIYVTKSRRRLVLYENGQPVGNYLIAIGRNEHSRKQSAGDWATPEGLYHIRRKNAASRFHLGLQIDYPNRDDADRGYGAGLISAAQREAIDGAIDRGALPPQDTRLGYEIEIHGGYNTVRTDVAGQPYLARWTRGCVALRNVDIDAIYAWAQDGTPVLIDP